MIQNIEHAITARMSCPVYVDRPALVLPPAPNIPILCSCAPVEVPIAPPPWYLELMHWAPMSNHQQMPSPTWDCANLWHPQDLKLALCPTAIRFPSPPSEIMQTMGILRMLWLLSPGWLGSFVEVLLSPLAGCDVSSALSHAHTFLGTLMYWIQSELLSTHWIDLSVKRVYFCIKFSLSHHPLIGLSYQ